MFLLSGCSFLQPKGVNGLPEYGDGEVSILVPKFVVISKLDEDKITLPKEREYVLRIRPGNHILTMSYIRDWKDSSLNELSTGARQYKKIVKWNPIEISHQFISGDQYRIGLDEPKSFEDARSKISSTPLWIEKVEQGQEAVVATETQIPSSKRVESNKELQEESVRKILDDIQSPVTNHDVNALDMIKYWWEQADEQERKDFLFWIYQK